jgi:(E)-4-hydroxy-3-methylbut-2-enyl-diphosphate synthase
MRSRTTEVKVCQEILQTTGPAFVHAAGNRLPGMWQNNISTFIPGTWQKKFRPSFQSSMPMWKEKYRRCREPERCRYGLHRKRPGRKQACRCRHQPAGQWRSASSAGISSMAKRHMTLRGEKIAEEFQQIVIDYIDKQIMAKRKRHE